MGNVERNTKKEIKKHVATIHCSNTLSLLQRKISNVLLYHAYPDLNAQEEHQLTIKTLCDLIGYKGHNQAAIKEALKGLVATVVEWDIIDNSGMEDWTASTILSSVRIKGSMCTYSYSPRMRELLFSPSIYAKINLIIQSKFKSNYGLALYENCVRYQGLPYTKWFDVDIFRKLMGVPDNTYQIFRDFKRRVLDKAVEEVNEYSEMKINPEIDRVGHKVVSIRFKLGKQDKTNKIGISTRDVNDTYTNTEHNSLVNKLVRDFNLEKSKAIETIEQYGIEKIQKNIIYIETSKSYANRQINNLAGYLLGALKNNYSNTPDKQGEKAVLDTPPCNEKDESFKKIYFEYIQKNIDAALTDIKKDEADKILKTFVNYLQRRHSVLTEAYNKHQLSDPLVKNVFCEYLILTKISVPTLLSYEQYVKSMNQEMNYEHT